MLFPDFKLGKTNHVKMTIDFENEKIWTKVNRQQDILVVDFKGNPIKGDYLFTIQVFNLKTVASIEMLDDNNQQ